MAPVRPELRGIQLTENFWSYEGACNCPKLKEHPSSGYCQGAFIFVPALWKGLQKLRDEYGPIYITRCYSCWAYHEHIYERLNSQRMRDGLHPIRVTLDSAHPWGEGADIRPENKIAQLEGNREILTSLGFTGIGWNMGADRRGLHLDIRHDKLTEWDYDKT
jgi:hypothetical protein